MDLINAIDSNGKDYDVFLQDLLSVNDDLPSDSDEVNNLQNAIIAHVNSRLNQSSTLNDGLNVLTHILPKCSKDVLSKYAVLWITKASQSLENSKSGIKEITLACKVLGSLIVRCKDVPELQKNVSMQTVKQLVIAISNLESERRSGAALYLIATILYHYREPSERLQASIRKIILLVVDADKKNLVQAGANCYTLLARVTERSFKPPAAKPTYTGWVYAQALLCNSLHAIMDDLFAGLIELESNDVWEKLDLPNIPEDNVVEYYRSLERRFENLCVYLSTMLRGCSGKSSVSPNEILQVLCRGLAVTPSSLRNENSFKRQMLHFILPKLHISLFTVLNAFIEGFKKQLVPFAITILQLYQQTLKWTEKVGENKTTISGGKPFKSVRIAVYKSLITWLSGLGTLSGIDIVADDFLPHILRDITPEKERVLLTVQKTQHLSRRALKRYKDNQYENSANLGSANVVKKDPCVNAELCRNALTSLEQIFFNANCSLKQSFYRGVQNVIVPLLYDYYLGKREENFYDADTTCRLHLLRALKSIQLNPHPSTPPPTQYSIEIFGMALRDTELSVVNEAKLVTAELEKTAHPSAPTLLLSVRNTDEPGDEELGIHWSRPTEEQQIGRENGVGQTESNVWERFRESRNEEVNTRSEGTREAQKNVKGTAKSLDGPTPSKQQKLGYDGPEELMDTSEDEIVVTSPREDETPLNEIVQSPPYESPRKRAIVKSDDSSGGKKEELPRSDGDEASYLTLKEIQGNEDDSRNGTENPKNNSTNDDEKTTKNGDTWQDPKAEESARQVDKCLDDDSNDDAIISLFCDELKDS